MLEDISIEKLKKMSISELNTLASEIRTKIIDTCSKNGGHIASNLGIVELTIALHYVFDSPFDKLIFDVSHQTYAHKIITGRSSEFDTLRKLDGISGFAKMTESEHDVYEGGHSSTSISAGIGFLEAKKLQPDSIGDVVSIIGDASIANGLAFEALNYLGDHPDEKQIVIINDNNMSISKNVGALARRYNHLRTRRSMKFLKKITPIRIKHALQYYAYKVDVFTSMGFKYFENINGHDIGELIRYLKFAKSSDKSIILHIKTTKGKGYEPSENDKEGIWHGVGPFDKESGKFINNCKGNTYGELSANRLSYLIDEEKLPIKVLCPGMILGCGLKEFSKNHPNNLIDVGIAEENAVVMASSMAISKIIPVIFIYSTFLQRAFDELIHDIARPSLHVVFCVDHAGIVPEDGATHQGIYDMAFLSSIPGVTILQPSSKEDVDWMIDYAVKELSGPVVIRYPKGEAKSTNKPTTKALWKLEKTGKDYIMSYGPDIWEISKIIEEKNLDIGLINCLDTTYFDDSILKQIDNSTIYVYEQVIESNNFSSKVLQYINNHNYNIKVKSICLNDGYLEEGSINELKIKYHISYDDLFNLINK